MSACSSDPSTQRAASAADAGGEAQTPGNARPDASHAPDASIGTRPDAGVGVTTDAGAPLDAAAHFADSGTGLQDGDAGSSGRLSDGGTFATMAVASPPTYLGSDGTSSTCGTTYRTTGFQPADSNKHPLFLYFVGTEFLSADQSSKYDCQAGEKVTEAMARRGFVGLSVEYANTLAGIYADKQPCMFDPNEPDSVISRACSLPNVDCSLGIATWGHSQGAALAHGAANYDTRVRAVWTTGYGGSLYTKLSYDRFRTVNGEGDTMNSSLDTSNKTANITASDCPNGGPDACLRADGSGWIVVRKSQCKVSAADHCWFDKTSCADNAETLEPNWVDRSSTTLFALESNADWVAATNARP